MFFSCVGVYTKNFVFSTHARHDKEMDFATFCLLRGLCRKNYRLYPHYHLKMGVRKGIFLA